MFKQGNIHLVKSAVSEQVCEPAQFSSFNKESFLVNGEALVELIEMMGYGYLILRGRQRLDSVTVGLGKKDDLRSVLRAHLNIELPEDPLSSASYGCNSIWWIGPTEWVLIGPVSEISDLETKLRKALSQEYAVVNTSGGLIYLRLKGSAAGILVRKSSPYNINAEHFSRGKVVGTSFGKTQVTLRSLDDGFDILCRRSFSSYLWAWLRDASREFGLAINRSSADS